MKIWLHIMRDIYLYKLHLGKPKDLHKFIQYINYFFNISVMQISELHVESYQKIFDDLLKYLNRKYQASSQKFMSQYLLAMKDGCINPGFSPQDYPRLKLSWKLRSSKIFSNNIEIQISRCPRGYSILPPLAVERYFQQRNV